MGPHARFEELYRAHAGGVRAYALRRTSAATADDVVSEVFLVAWRRLERVPDEPLPWLLAVARRVLANRRRGETRSAALTARLAEDHREPRAEYGSADTRVMHALGVLGEDDRELLMLVAWEDLEPAEIALVLGIRRGTVNVRLHRARRRFAAALVDADHRAGHNDRRDHDLEVRR